MSKDIYVTMEDYMLHLVTSVTGQSDFLFIFREGHNYDMDVKSCTICDAARSTSCSLCSDLNYNEFSRFKNPPYNIYDLREDKFARSYMNSSLFFVSCNSLYVSKLVKMKVHAT